MTTEKHKKEKTTQLAKGTVVRFLPSLGEERSPEYWMGKILYYPKTYGILTIRKRIERSDNEKARRLIFENVPTVMIHHLDTGNVLRVAADCIDKSSPEALKLRFNTERR